MTNHGKKIIAPVIVTIIVVAYFLTIASVFFTVEMPGFVMILKIIFSLAFTAAAIYVLIDRIREIKGGQEDDLGKY